ncbi:MAG: GNAT family N-acetyltransferase [Cyanobium sp.]
MPSPLAIRPLQSGDIAPVTDWARAEGFCPGHGDVAIYRQTDRQGLWVGWLEQEPIGCIAGVRYSQAYGFIGLFLVTPPHRGRGHGVRLWRHALDHLADVACVGLEAAPERIEDYASWGFRPASITTRWRRPAATAPGAASRGLRPVNLESGDPPGPAPRANAAGLTLLEAAALPDAAVEAYDAAREASPRPHFLRDWLHHPAGTVLALVDGGGQCHGFGRIRPCLLPQGSGWRIGPLLADTPALAERLLRRLMAGHPGEVLLDAPGANAAAVVLMRKLGFTAQSETLRMYRGEQPTVSLADVYGLACLELG